MKQAITTTKANPTAKSYTVPAGVSMVYFLGTITKQHKVGDIVRLKHKGTVYVWRKYSESGWTKAKRNPNPKPATKAAIARRASGSKVAINGSANWRKAVVAVAKRKIQETGDIKTAQKYLHEVRAGLTWQSASDKEWLNKTITKLYSNKPLTRNGTAADFKRYTKVKLQDLARKFQGEANGIKHRLLESDYTPQDKYRLGYLVQMKIRGKRNGKNVVIPITFDGDSMLSADRRDNLHVSGKDARIQNGITLPKQGQLKYVGELVQIDYVTAKKHIENGETVRFFHKLGEVTKEVPNLFVDHEGFPIVQGGGYEIWDVGIVN